MLPRPLFLVLLACLSAVGSAQRQPPSPAEQAMGWLQTQWKRVEQEGRPMAERIVREFPQRFKGMKAQVARVTQMAAQFSDAHQLDQKKALLMELWRVRGSLNLLSLCSPEIVQQLTGLDPKTLQSLQNQVAIARAKLSRL